MNDFEILKQQLKTILEGKQVNFTAIKEINAL